MLIIFDLDDTLIDTSLGIIPWKLEKMLESLSQLGLVVPHFQDSLDTLLRLNHNAESSEQALEEFFEIIDADPKFAAEGKKIMYEHFPEDMPVCLREGAQEVLQQLSLQHHLALVTVGRADYQQFKIEKAGIDSSIFCTISIVEGWNKKPSYASIREGLGLPPSAVCVCGDRVDIDLLPAKELGFKTVHLRKGRGERVHQLHHYVDYSIDALSELPSIVEKLTESFENQTGNLR